jgi:tRNA dimethylallyltransferase
MKDAASSKPRLLVLLGPTAVGKTNLSLQIAHAWNCEIISGDSMQVYRGMDIGTAKATLEERREIPHHMIDIHDPDDPFSAAEFQERTARLIADITARGKLPFIVGGTGLYIESLCYRYQFSETGSDEAFRRELTDIAEREGGEAIWERLKSVDPSTAERLHANDWRRTIRALEVHHLTGKTMSEQLSGQKKESPYHLCLIGLTMERQMLYNRIEERIDAMMAQGLLQEVRSLLDQGYAPDNVSMQGLGYKELVGYLNGHVSLDEAVRMLKRDTRHFAKRQLSWFRHMNDISWVDITDTENFSAQYEKINDIITGKFVLCNEYTSS